MSNYHHSTVASHYNNRQAIGRDKRHESVILGLRNYNNWVKATMIHQYVKPGSDVFDLGCGKGGDLIKYSHARIERYVGADIAEQSVQQAKERYDGMRGRRYPAQFFAVDCFTESIVPQLTAGDYFDVVSSQFVIHYAFDSEEHVRMLLSNITSRLRTGGIFMATVPDAYWIVKKLRNAPGLEFGNNIYKIRFEQKDEFPIYGHKYWFELKEAIDDCPEYLVHFPTFQSLAYEYGLQLEYKSTLHEFYMEHKQDPEAVDLLYKMNACPKQGEISPDEWEAIGIYMACIFRKVK